MCSKVVRLAFLYANDAETQKKWSAALESRACQYVGAQRSADCLALTKAVVGAQRKFFDGKDSKLSEKELKGTTEQIGLLIDSKAYGICRHIGCCSIYAEKDMKNKNKHLPVKPLTTPKDQKDDPKDIARDRESLVRDRFTLDQTRETLFKQRRDNNNLKAKLDLHQIDLAGREKKLAVEKKKLLEAQNKLKNDLADLERKKTQMKNRKEGLDQRDKNIDKKEKNLNTREDYVKDREQVAWTREEQLGIPHPPKRTEMPPKGAEASIPK